MRSSQKHSKASKRNSRQSSDNPTNTATIASLEPHYADEFIAAGETDIALFNSQRTLAVFNNYGVRSFWVLSSHGHEWLNWRRYLYQTAQTMFPEDR